MLPNKVNIAENQSLEQIQATYHAENNGKRGGLYRQAEPKNRKI